MREEPSASESRRDPQGLGAAERERYARHLSLPEVGLEGQARLATASVLLVGAGGLAAPAGLYLAAAGVGRIGLVDDDRVEPTNLQRQVLFDEADVGALKVEAARDRLAGINPLIEIETHRLRLVASNVREVIGGYDLVLDGTDNFAAKYLLNDACFFEGTPLIYGSVQGFRGQVTVLDARRGPCYRCLFPEPPDPERAPSCAEAGVLGVMPGLVGTFQALEALKWILQRGEPLVGRLLTIDALAGGLRSLTVAKDPACALCGPEPAILDVEDHGTSCATAAPLETELPFEISPCELRDMFSSGEDFLLLDVRERWEFERARIEGSTLLPLSELEERVDELAPQRPMIVMCKVGARSAAAVEFLRHRGFRNVRNLRDGIYGWAREVDPTVLPP